MILRLIFEFQALSLKKMKGIQLGHIFGIKFTS